MYSERYNESRMIMSPNDFYNLQCGYGGIYGGSSSCGNFTTWKEIYSFNLSSFNSSFIIGGEGLAWTEMFTPDSIEAALWPRVAAYAGMLWNDKNITEVQLVGGLISFNHNMLDPLGIDYSPVTSRYCEINYKTCFKPNDK